jgi:hypothetical protein
MPVLHFRRCALPNRLRIGLTAAIGSLMWAVAGEPPPPPIDVRLELTAGDAIRGGLVVVTDEAIEIRAEGQHRSFPVPQVRRVIREHAEPPRRHLVAVVTRDGGTLAGDRFIQPGDNCLIAREDGTIELPADLVARVAWLAPDEQQPPWLAGIPAQPVADLVVIRRDDAPTFVECAVSRVDDDSVTVVLDGDTIPVKRAKVAGIVWLREPSPPPTGPVVVIAGGRLVAEHVRWSPDEFILDDVVRLPASALHSIDYAVGRTVPLTTIDPEQLTVDPAFGSLATIEGLAGFFAPRIIQPTQADGQAALILRPRTVATWRVPADARRFRARLARDVVKTAPATVAVSVAVDGREVFRSQLRGPAADDAPPAPADVIDVDVATSRRLTLTIDFVGGDLGCPVSLTDAVFEK